MQEQYALYADNFPIWAQQSNGMLQINIWSVLRELGIGANLQHYNPVIDEKVKALFNIPEYYRMKKKTLIKELLLSNKIIKGEFNKFSFKL